MIKTQIAIVGGGMVGSVMALALARQGLEIILIEGRQPQRQWPPGEIDLRVSALTRASENVLRNLGAWQRMQELGVSAYQQMRVWDAGSQGEIRFDCAEIAEENLGHIVENRVTQLALWQLMESSEHVQIICPARVEGVDLGQQQLRLDNGQVIQAQLIIAADGRESPLRNMLGIETFGWAYDQHALVATVAPAEWHQATAWQRFLSNGPLALLPLADGRCSIVWSNTPDQADYLKKLDDESFLKQLAQASEHCLGGFTHTSVRASFPLKLQHAKQYVKEHFALIGDAAHAIHPLAGQGVNLGIQDAICLAEKIQQGITAGRQAGVLRDLRAYERARKADNLMMLAAMDGFKRLFSNSHPLLSLARGMGLNMANRIEFLNKGFMRKAMGVGTDMPELARMDNDYLKQNAGV